MISSLISFLKGIFDPENRFNEASWFWMSHWSWWINALVVLLILFSLRLVWLNSSRVTVRQRILILSLRVISVILLFLIFLQPALRLEDVTRVKNYIGIFVDESLSMSLPQSDTISENPKSRLQQAVETLEAQNPVIQQWKSDHIVEYYGFSEHLNAVENQRFEAKGNSTMLINAFDEYITRHQAEEIAGVVLLTDADDNSDLIPPKIKEIPVELKRSVSQLHAPIHTLILGPQDAPKDIAIRTLKADDFVFTRNAVSVEVDVSFSSYSRSFDVPIRLLRDGILISQKVIHYLPEQSNYMISFEFVPQLTGEESFRVEVEPQENESVKINNHVDFSMKIIRDKIRALQVVGRPSWDEKFLRSHLKQNPNVDLISFFILRTNSSVETADQSELSLIPFPTQELFEEQLGSFDLVIFQNFTYKGYRMKQYLPLIKDYVTQGGGFVMVGGDLSFGAGQFAQTSIADFLPVKLFNNGADQISKGKFKAKLTDIAKTHPITNLSLIPEENQKIWAGLSELSGSNIHQGLKENAISLIEREYGDGNKDSIINIYQYEQGRVMSIATDSLWRWAFNDKEVGGKHYHKFWGNSIRWLISDPSLNPLKIKADQEKYSLQSDINIDVTLLSQDYQPLADEEVELLIEEILRDESRDFISQQDEDAQQEEDEENPFDLFTTSPKKKYQRLIPQRIEPKTQTIQSIVLKTNKQGEIHFKWKSPKQGAFRAKAQYKAKSDQMLLTDQDVFVVQDDPLEFRSIQTRPELGQWISQLSKGKVIDLNDSWGKLNFQKPKVMRVNRRQDIPLWSNAYLLALIVLLLSSEWYLRRKYGLL